jgi:hypothetical protein
MGCAAAAIGICDRAAQRAVKSIAVQNKINAITEK